MGEQGRDLADRPGETRVFGQGQLAAVRQNYVHVAYRFRAPVPATVRREDPPVRVGRHASTARTVSASTASSTAYSKDSSNALTDSLSVASTGWMTA